MNAALLEFKIIFLEEITSWHFLFFLFIYLFIFILPISLLMYLNYWKGLFYGITTFLNHQYPLVHLSLFMFCFFFIYADIRAKWGQKWFETYFLISLIFWVASKKYKVISGKFWNAPTSIFQGKILSTFSDKQHQVNL